MKLKGYIWIVLVLVIYDGANTLDSQLQSDNEYYDFAPEVDDSISLNSNERPKKLVLSALPPAAVMNLIDGGEMPQSTECITTEAAPTPPPPPPPQTDENPAPEQPPAAAPATASPVNDEQEQKAKELRNLVQHLYVAQARVQLEASEIKKAQAIANTAQQALEEAANHVRAITAALQNSQQEVASAAIRAQTAQLQLAAHDQLLFAARQDVDALSSQMVGLQAAEGISQPKITVDLSGLIEKLKQPLQEAEKPTAVPSVVQFPTPTKKVYQMQQQQLQQQQIQQQRIHPQHQQKKRMMQNFYYE